MPQHLKAAWIGNTDFNKFDGWARGGIDRGAGTPDTPWQDDLNTAPVDADTTINAQGYPTMLYEACEQHQYDTSFNGLLTSVPLRNSTSPLYNESTGLYWQDASASTYFKQIVKAHVPAYIAGGWDDIFKRDSLITFVNWPAPVKMVVGPWRHGEYMMIPNPGNFDSYAEIHRWFDFWLKGIKNGIMDEPPIYYDVMITPVVSSPTMNMPVSKEWRFAWQWPLPEARPEKYYLSGEVSGTAPSVNDGTLSPLFPKTKYGQDNYQAVYGITTTSELIPQVPVPMATEFDQKGLTYTSAPLTKDTAVIGHPLVDLWVSSSATDGDFFAFLEDVLPSGTSWWVTDGRLRASLRKRGTPPYNFLGLPWYRAFSEDVTPLIPGKPAKLAIDMAPTSYIFQAGHRIRLTITNSEGHIVFENTITPAPLETVYHNAVLHSSITLPVVDRFDERSEGCDRD
jgi:hypothetical protein